MSFKINIFTKTNILTTPKIIFACACNLIFSKLPTNNTTLAYKNLNALCLFQQEQIIETASKI